MKKALFTKETYPETFKHSGNSLVRSYLKIFSWFRFGMN
ncbi:DUF6747 family protein [Maribacter sp. 2210JD10-5]